MSRIDDLYAAYLKPLTKKLIGFGQSDQDADDIAQETFIAVSKRLDRIPPEREWWYLLVSGYNNARKRATRMRSRRTVPLEPAHEARTDGTPSVERSLIQREEVAQFRARFEAVMAELSPETRQAIVLRSRGLDSKAIAQTLGLTHQAVRTRLSRAFELIRARVGTPPDDVEWLQLPGDEHDHHN